jgi:hypothetical protein
VCEDLVSFPQSETDQKENCSGAIATPSQEVPMRQSKFTETQIVSIWKEADLAGARRWIWPRGIVSAVEGNRYPSGAE